MVFHPINDLAEICARRGIIHAVLSPGSRCAPLTLAFVRHPEITTKIIPDERSAAFIALGMALKLNTPVVLICTSGTAVLNYGPAIAEAFFQHIPLLVLTADRPAELIGQQDGQTIYQEEVYGRHVKKSYCFDGDYTHPEAASNVTKTLSEAIALALEFPSGPVHINIPFREPFFPDRDEPYTYSENIVLAGLPDKDYALTPDELTTLEMQWRSFKKILVLGGQGTISDELEKYLSSIAGKMVVAGDIISNLHFLEEGINRLDIFPASLDNEFIQKLQPELLITFGNSTVSNNLKLFLRKHKPVTHWHIQPHGHAADTYQSLTHVVRTTPELFFKHVTGWTKIPVVDAAFKNAWESGESKAISLVDQFLKEAPFGEFVAVQQVMECLPAYAEVHLANSMPVRLVNLTGISKDRRDLTIYSNRGTSGIDGSNSAATGMAMVSKHPVVLITGDMAFFYDRNAFWHNYSVPNLYIVLLNNHAGGIFGVIDGPAAQPELNEYFETHQKLNARNTAKEYEMDYFYVNSSEELREALQSFFQSSDKPRILEIETDNESNKSIFRQLKRRIAGTYT